MNKSNIESHVTSLELSKMLRDTGLELKTQFYWRFSNDGGSEREIRSIDGGTVPHEDNEYAGCVAAPLASELLEALPTYFALTRDENGMYLCEDMRSDGKKFLIASQKNAADACGSTWYWLNYIEQCEKTGERPYNPFEV